MAGGFAVIYQVGDLVLDNPVEACSIFIFVIVFSALLEYLLHAAGNVDNKYFRIIFEAVCEEVMIVGVLALMLLFVGGTVASVSPNPKRFTMIFNWAHMCLFFMSVFFAFIVTGMVASLSIAGKAWRVFEETRMNTDPRLTKNEIRYKMACEKFKATLEFCGINGESMHFADYIGKACRRNVVEMSDLSWKTWCGLSILVILNTIRGWLVRPDVTSNPNFKVDDMSNFELISSFGSYIAVVGYGTVAMFLIMHITLQNRLTHFLDRPVSSKPPDETMSGEDRLKKLEDPTENLFFGSLETTTGIIQVLIMFFEWYLSVFCLGMIHEINQNFSDKRFFVGASFMMIVAGVGPMVVFMYTIPWTIFSVTCLSSLGSELNQTIVNRLLKRDDADEEEEAGGHGGHGHGGHGHKGHGHGGHGKGGHGGHGGHGEKAHTAHGDNVPRPTFLDEDEDWNGHQIVPPMGGDTRYNMMMSPSSSMPADGTFSHSHQ
eukprot:PhF_6_TR25319/c0_g1_i3/m.34974